MARSLLCATFSLAALFLGLALADVQTCANQQYDTAVFVCHDDYILCPIVAGEPLDHCNGACYSSLMHSCTDGALVQLPFVDAGRPFLLTTSNPAVPEFDGLVINACNFRWNINGPLCTDCPDDVFRTCPDTSQFLVTAGTSDSTIGMHAIVPGGQTIFIDPATSTVGYTKADSAALPSDAILSGLASYDGGGFVNIDTDALGWVACPPDAISGEGYSLHVVNSTNKNLFASCTPINLKVETQSYGVAGAWAYT